MGKSKSTAVSYYAKQGIVTISLRLCIVNDFWADMIHVDEYKEKNFKRN